MEVVLMPGTPVLRLVLPTSIGGLVGWWRTHGGNKPTPEAYTTTTTEHSLARTETRLDRSTPRPEPELSKFQGCASIAQINTVSDGI